MSAGGGCSHHLNSEFVCESPSFGLQIIENFHMIRGKAERRNDNVLYSFSAQSAEMVENIWFQPWLRGGTTAALIRKTPIRQANRFGNQAGRFAELLFIIAGLGHGARNAVSGNDQPEIREFLGRKLSAGPAHPVGAGFNKTGMIVKDPQLVDFRSIGTNLRLRRGNVLPILPAAWNRNCKPKSQTPNPT